MKEVYSELARVLAKGERVALATVLNVSGSSPGKQGFKMLIYPDGRTLGTVGGGAIEARVIKDGRELLSRGESQVFHYDLAKDAGMSCGGSAEIFIESVIGNPRLYIFGSGHVAMPVCQLAKTIGFSPVVLDDRSEFANAERFPWADEIRVGNFARMIEEITFDQNSYVVIVTRGHAFDQEVLHCCLLKPEQPRYIGMIGSRAKVAKVFKQLEEAGISREMLATVHAPIGLPIGAETPAEIAVCILAEIIQVKNQNSTHDVGCMG